MTEHLAPDPPPPSPWKGRLGNAALLAVSLAVTFWLADLWAAKLLSKPPSLYPATRFDDPHLVKNSNNFRDFEYPVEKAEGVFRIIVVGDSFTQGGGVNFDDIYPKRLERYLLEYQNVRKRRYQVLNWGRPGSSTPYEASRIMEEAVRWKPDLVLLGYCLNDAEDQSDREGIIQLRRRYRPDKFEEGRGLVGLLTARSALVRLVRRRLYNTRMNRGEIAYYRALYREDEAGWRKTQAAVMELGEFSRRNGLPVAVVVFPLFSWDLDVGYPFGDIHQRLHGLFERAGLAYLDLLPAYRGLEHRVLEAVPFEDPHPSDVAHRIAAEYLYLWLKENRFLPRGRRIARSLKERRLPPPW